MNGTAKYYWKIYEHEPLAHLLENGSHAIQGATTSSISFILSVWQISC